ncbi:hypothetical protein KP79_PYT18551 [Mizuhopecten yessoensis]|uniref:Uncharacterized protein n=1 Tax=Mizuhopecten yessoensis TaxID=6573 RepID=A0A210QUF6_MIZYE|nr:hypothetical protein KP79_PYT18551 [Mizuhopecten yessoensis]
MCSRSYFSVLITCICFLTFLSSYGQTFADSSYKVRRAKQCLDMAIGFETCNYVRKYLYRDIPNAFCVHYKRECCMTCMKEKTTRMIKSALSRIRKQGNVKEKSNV